MSEIIGNKLDTALKQIINNKCPGEDRITSEILKVGFNDLLDVVTRRLVLTKSRLINLKKLQII